MTIEKKKSCASLAVNVCYGTGLWHFMTRMFVLPLLKGAKMRTTDGEKVVHVNDIDLFYQDYGSGSPLVLLHGWFGSNAFWDPYINALTQEYRVIVPDFRGHGRSTNPNDYAFSERDFAHDIFALLDHLGIERFKGVGFSSGGMTFLHMATEQSKRIEAMILIGTVHYFPSERNDIASYPVVITDYCRQWG
jgi:pimeloyl-ACP methyl ester carboxylesterase